MSAAFLTDDGKVRREIELQARFPRSENTFKFVRNNEHCLKQFELSFTYSPGEFKAFQII